MGETEFTIFLIASFITAVVLFVLAVLAFNLKAQGSISFGLLATLFALWCFAIGGKMLSVSEDMAFRWAVVITIAGSLAPPTFLWFAIIYTSRRSKCNWWWIPLSFIEPLIAILMFVIPGFRHLYISEFIYEEVMGYLTTVGWQVGPVYLFHTVMSALFVLAGDFLILQHALEWNKKSRHTVIILIFATSLPILTTMTRMVNLFPKIHGNTDVFAFALATAIAGIVIYRGEILKFKPVSARQLMNELPDPLLVFDLEGRFVDSNPVAKETFPLPLDPVVKQQFKEFLSDPDLNQGQHIHKKFELLKDGRHQHYEVHLSPIFRYSLMIGYQVFLRDVTALTQSMVQLEQLATTDPLTGLYNRRYFHTEGERVFAQAVRYQHPICVMTFDIDHFKQANDQHGHHGGDEVLQQVAELLLKICRKADIVARFGGDEFFVLLPESSSEFGVALARRIRYQLKDKPFVVDGVEIPTSFSFGIASCRPGISKDSFTLDELMREADAKLYESKQGGRGMICFSSF